jgi:hypothetical protein
MLKSNNAQATEVLWCALGARSRRAPPRALRMKSAENDARRRAYHPAQRTKSCTPKYRRYFLNRYNSSLKTQSEHGEMRQAGRHLDLHVHGPGLDALERHCGDPLDHAPAPAQEVRVTETSPSARTFRERRMLVGRDLSVNPLALGTAGKERAQFDQLRRNCSRNYSLILLLLKLSWLRTWERTWTPSFCTCMPQGAGADLRAYEGCAGRCKGPWNDPWWTQAA